MTFVGDLAVVALDASWRSFVSLRMTVLGKEMKKPQ